MNISNIKSLAEILSAHGLTSIEVNEGETRIRIEKNTPAQPVRTHVPPLTAGAPPGADAVDAAETPPIGAGGRIEVKSPMVGVFYSAASPESDTYVNIGSIVRKGDVLCVIETMKLMNEITAEHDGEVIDICVKNGEIVEFGQVLFVLG